MNYYDRARIEAARERDAKIDDAEREYDAVMKEIDSQEEEEERERERAEQEAEEDGQ